MIDWDRPLYLYFLDRELVRLMSHSPNVRTTERIIKVLLLGTSSTLYCGISLLWESPALGTDLIPFVSYLIKNAVLDVVSHHATAGEFLESRRVLYSHDSDRYPMYFSRSADQDRMQFEPTHYKADSTTDALSKQMLEWALKGSGAEAQSSIEAEMLASVRKEVKAVLVDRSNQAITLSLFHESAGVSPSISAIIQRKISGIYASHYIEFGHGDVPTGIFGFDLFETQWAHEFPLYDVPVLSAILSILGLAPVLDQPWQAQRQMWEEVSLWRDSFVHTQFRTVLRLLMQALLESVGIENIPSKRYALRESILGLIRHAGVKNKAINQLDWIEVFYRLTGLSTRLRKNSKFDRSMDLLMQNAKSQQVDVLLVTVADVERDTILQVFREELGQEATRRHGKRKTYYELGVLGGARIVMVQSEMGSVGPGAALSTVADACDELHAKAVVAVGIAFGTDKTKQAIGDVLVSRQMHSYEPQRVGTTETGSESVIPRGATVDASVRLLDRFRAAAAGWKETTVRFGLIVSGEKLIDNIGFRDELKARYVEAIGGEMEGAGLYSAAVQRNTEWIVVKGICDWADGHKRVNKKQRQEIAAGNAARLVLRAIKFGGFSG